MINMSSVLNDEKIFEESEKFKPERYLEGDIALKKQRTIPFGIGERFTKNKHKHTNGCCYQLMNMFVEL